MVDPRDARRDDAPGTDPLFDPPVDPGLRDEEREDPVTALADLWERLEPPPLADDVDQTDASTRAVVGWLRAAWVATAVADTGASATGASETGTGAAGAGAMGTGATGARAAGTSAGDAREGATDAAGVGVADIRAARAGAADAGAARAGAPLAPVFPWRRVAWRRHAAAAALLVAFGWLVHSATQLALGDRRAATEIADRTDQLGTDSTPGTEHEPGLGPEHGGADDVDAAGRRAPATRGVELVAVADDHLELRSGAVRLVLLQAPPTP